MSENHPHQNCAHCTAKDPIDSERRHFLTTSLRVLGCVGVVGALFPFISSLKPNRTILESNGPLDVDVSALLPGQQMTVMWRGKPIWIIRRTPDMLAQLQQANDELRDPHSLVQQQPVFAQNDWRSKRPEYLVVVGVCTHLGCIPQYKPQDPMFFRDNGGFYCPCHGSKFDLAGRVYRHVPAPINLEVPLYRFVSDHLIRLGEDVP
ncbi:MAG: ubiquinol-cytochrome c reductase iron-sulfur subunit [Legionella sp.]|nr:MAG: ubiquinol-cytochrome c reductase iron-sulfur subunit [Legionella sp.]